MPFCLSACISQKPHVHTLQHISYSLAVAMPQSPAYDNVRYFRFCRWRRVFTGKSNMLSLTHKRAAHSWYVWGKAWHLWFPCLFLISCANCCPGRQLKLLMQLARRRRSRKVLLVPKVLQVPKVLEVRQDNLSRSRKQKVRLASLPVNAGPWYVLFVNEIVSNVALMWVVKPQPCVKLNRLIR